MKKFKFNFKLTLYLVGLFVSILLIILSGKFQICRSFGLIGLGISFVAYIYFYSDNVNKAIKKIDKEIEEIETDGELASFEDYEDEDWGENEQEFLQDLTLQEKEYVVMELNQKKKKIKKNNIKIKCLFALSGALFIICGIILLA